MLLWLGFIVVLALLGEAIEVLAKRRHSSMWMTAMVANCMRFVQSM